MDLIARIESAYDAIARVDARTERHGALLLFIAQEPGFTRYARPDPTVRRPITADEIAAVRARQRQLGLPEAFEWVHEVNPELLALAEAAGLNVVRAPLMVFDPQRVPPDEQRRQPAVRLLDPHSDEFAADLATCLAVADLGFSNPGTAVGTAGPAERDAAWRPIEPEQVRAERRRAETGTLVRALLETDAGAVATAGLQRAGDVAEIAGVATLPAARRQGFGTAITLALARSAVDSGVDVVFLSAADPQVARVYERAGFVRVGTACIAEPAAS